MKERIVIIEDDNTNLKVLTYMLKPMGYEIIPVMRGDEALDIVEEHMPDLILLDIRLPGIDGFEICEILKSKDKTKHIPVIFTSVMSQKENRIKGLTLGAADFISKPFYKEEVILRIENRLELSRVEKKLKRTIENQSLLLDNIDPMIWHLKDAKTLGKVNTSFADFFHREKEEVENTSLEKLLTHEDLTQWIKSNDQVFESKRKTIQTLETTNGALEKRMLTVTKIPKINKEGEVDYIICSAEDVTERNRKEERIKYLTFHDPLTNLYNRAFYEEELIRLDVERKLPLSIISCDVNDLKLANDIFGHQIGDQLLQEVANVLKLATRKEDIVSRWGGDEFAVILPNTTKEAADKIIDRINELSKEQTYGLVPISIALGVATKVSPEEDAKDLFKKAEDRMYENKGDIKNNNENSLLEWFRMKYYGEEFKDLRNTSDIEKKGKEIGAALKLDKNEQKRLDLLIEYHDIGKISVSREILDKGGALSNWEWVQYKKHVEVGHRIAKAIPMMDTVAEEILYHHEHYDGGGFPEKLQGEEIPYLARIMAILDIYDGLCSSIYYPVNQEQYFKEPLSKEEVIKEMQDRSGTVFDPEILQIFIKKVVSKK